MLAPEPFAGAPETADHLVGDEQDVALAADPLDGGPVACWWYDHAAGALHGLADEGGDVVGADLVDLAGALLRCPSPEGLRVLLSALRIPIGLGDVDDAGNGQPALRVHRLHAPERGASHGRAVIAVVPGDDDPLGRAVHGCPVMPDHANDRVVRLRA